MPTRNGPVIRATGGGGTNATTVTITNNNAETENNVIVFVADAATATGNVGLESDADLNYNPNTGLLTSTGFAGALTGNADTVTTNANLTGHITSTGNAAVLGSFTSAQLNTALTGSATGSGDAVFATSPTLVTPALGTPASGVMTNMTGAVTASIADNAVTLAKMAAGTDGNIISYDDNGDPIAIATGTDGQVLTSAGPGEPPAFEAIPAAGTVVVIDGTDTSSFVAIFDSATGSLPIKTDGALTYNAGTGLLTATTVTTTGGLRKRTDTTASHATPTINAAVVDYYRITGQTEAITNMSTNMADGTYEGQTVWIAITDDNSAARAIAWGTKFEASTTALPTTTVQGARLDVAFVWNTVTSKWRCLAVA